MFKVSTNGWITFDTSVTDPSYDNSGGLPDQVGEVQLAPFWDDLDVITVCTKTVGQSLVVQWRGTTFSLFGPGTPVEFQAVLDPTDDSIELVWGPGHQANGASATIGVQDPTGDQATVISHNTPFAGTSSQKLSH
jgi:hypothetical protein